MSARLAVVEHNHTDFRRQLNEVLLTSQNNEQALKAVNLALNSLAAMVTSIMNKLESMTSVNEPNPTANNEDVHGSISKSMCEN